MPFLTQQLPVIKDRNGSEVEPYEPRTEGSRQFGVSLPTRTHSLIILAALFIISCALRLRSLDAPLWIDEGISIGIASHPLHEIAHVLREDGSPPLYYWI